MSTTALADRMFTPGGLAVALAKGCRIHVDAPGLPTGFHIDADDLECARCDGAIQAPRQSPAKYLAYNAFWCDGLCAECAAIRRCLFAAALLSYA